MKVKILKILPYDEWCLVYYEWQGIEFRVYVGVNETVEDVITEEIQKRKAAQKKFDQIKHMEGTMVEVSGK